VLKVLLLAALVVAAFASRAGDWAHFAPFAARHSGAPPIGPALAGALVAAFFSFGGWWEATKIAGEVRDPARTLPRALWIGLLIVTALYAVATLAFLFVVPIEAVVPGEAFAAQVGAEIFGAAGGLIVAAVVVICVAGSLAATLMVAPRVYFAMARDGLFPPAAAAVHPRFGTPARAIAIQAVLASALVLIGSFETIVAYFMFITIVFIGATVAGVFVLRRRDLGWQAPGYPWTPAAFLLCIGALLVLLAFNTPRQAALGAGIVLLGIPVYHLLWRHTPPPVVTVEETPS
jgi:APA family basic amino acid/polyamine antiporter